MHGKPKRKEMELGINERLFLALSLEMAFGQGSRLQPNRF